MPSERKLNVSLSENKGRINFRQGVAMGPICNI